MHSHRGREGVILSIDVDAIGYCHHSASFLSLVLPRELCHVQSLRSPTARCRNGPATARPPERAMRSRAPVRFQPRTELASCKDTRSSPALRDPALRRSLVPATSHDSPTASICARDSALEVSCRRVASRTSYKLRESLGAARPTRRAADATPTEHHQTPAAAPAASAREPQRTASATSET